MADEQNVLPKISKLTLPTGTTYEVKDAFARNKIEEIEAAIRGAITFIGITTTPLSDGATTNPIVINGESVTAINGNLAVYNNGEFLFVALPNETAYWIACGDLSILGALAYKNSASGSFTPHGTVSVSTATTTDLGTTVAPAASGDATYTPAGSIVNTEIDVETSKENVCSISDVGTLPALTTTVENETLTIGFNCGTLPTKAQPISVVTDASAEFVSAPAFVGTGVRLETDSIDVPASFNASFSGTTETVTVS